MIFSRAFALRFFPTLPDNSPECNYNSFHTVLYKPPHELELQGRPRGEARRRVRIQQFRDDLARARVVRERLDLQDPASEVLRAREAASSTVTIITEPEAP